MPLTASDLHNWQKLVAGGMSGVGLWVPMYAIDTVKSKVQATILDKPVSCRPDGTTLREVRKIYRQHGLRGFMYGVNAIMGRAFFSNAIGFWIWEYTRTVFRLDK